MAVSSIAEIVDALCNSPVLRPEQAQKLAETAPRFSDPTELVRHLVKLNYLTLYQGKKVLAGHADQLVIGQYVVLDKIGEGGMGKVYKARQLRMDRVIALKVVRSDLVSNELALRRFRREAQAAAQLEHLNIVRLFDADQDGDKHFLAMEFVEGADLTKLIKTTGPLPVHQACDYIRQAALGLQHAHEKGLVHRDIKPSNMLITSGHNEASGKHQPGVLKVLDMGLARNQITADGSDVTALTQTGTVIGTPDFMSPEQAKNSSQVDARADLYSLGCTLFFLLTGQSPFPKGTTLEKLIQHQTDAPPPIHFYRQDVPNEVAGILYALLAKHPDQRPPNAAVLAGALEPWCRPIPGGLRTQPVPAAAPANAALSAGPASLGSTTSMSAVNSPFNFDSTLQAPQASPLKAELADSAPRSRTILYVSAALLAILMCFGAWQIFRKPAPGSSTLPEQVKNDPKTQPKVESKPQPKDLEPIDRFLPNDTAAAAVIDVRQFTKSAFFIRHLRPLIGEQLAETKQNFGFDPLTAVERITIAAPPEGAVQVSILVEGRGLLTEKFLKWADAQEQIKRLPSADLYDLSELRQGEGPMFAGIVGRNPDGVFFSPEKSRVVDALAKASGKTRTDLRDRTVASGLPRPAGSAALLHFGLGKSARIGENRGTLESEGVFGISGTLKLTDALEGECVLEGQNAFELRRFYMARKAEFALLALFDKRLTPLADIINNAKPQFEMKGRPAVARVQGQISADKLRDWFEKLKKEPE